MRRDAAGLASSARDDLCSRAASEQRRASLALGRNLLRAAAAIALPAEDPGIAWAADTLGETTPRASVFGAVSAAFGAAAGDAAQAYLYSVLAGMVAAAVRLARVSPLEGQAALRRALAASSPGLDETPGFFSPLLDVAAMRHELLEPRLFAS